jgi:hypothetical protein
MIDFEFQVRWSLLLPPCALAIRTWTDPPHGPKLRKPGFYPKFLEVKSISGAPKREAITGVARGCSPPGTPSMPTNAKLSEISGNSPNLPRFPGIPQTLPHLCTGECWSCGSVGSLPPPPCRLYPTHHPELSLFGEIRVSHLLEFGTSVAPQGMASPPRGELETCKKSDSESELSSPSSFGLP